MWSRVVFARAHFFSLTGARARGAIGYRNRNAAPRSLAVGHVSQCRSGGAGSPDRASHFLDRYLDGVARKDDRDRTSAPPPARELAAACRGAFDRRGGPTLRATR